MQPVIQRRQLRRLFRASASTGAPRRVQQSEPKSCLTCLGQCNLPKKFCRLVAPSPTGLNCNHDQSAPGMWPPSLGEPGQGTAPSPPRLDVAAPRALRRAMSIANWAPLKQSKSCASISMRLSSLPGTLKFMSRRYALNFTRAPADPIARDTHCT